MSSRVWRRGVMRIGGWHRHRILWVTLIFFPNSLMGVKQRAYRDFIFLTFKIIWSPWHKTWTITKKFYHAHIQTISRKYLLKWQTLIIRLTTCSRNSRLWVQFWSLWTWSPVCVYCIISKFFDAHMLLSGLWGMNVHVPGEDTREGYTWFVSIIACLAAFAMIGGYSTYRFMVKQ